MKIRGVFPLALLVLAPLACGDPGPGPTPLPGQEDLAPPPPVKTGPALHLTIRGGDDRQPLPSRAIIQAVAPTEQPKFSKDGALAQEIAPSVVGVPEGILLMTGDGTFALAPGTYELFLMQGPEYEAVRQKVTIVGKEVAEVDVTLSHSVRTDGWLAADMHIHTSRSYDSKLPPLYRVVTEVASGVELIVPTEHSAHGDLAEEIQSLRYGTRAVSIPGSEYGFSQGHLGIYPVVYDPKGGELFGAPSWQKWPWTTIDAATHFPIIHALPGEPVIVVNHPRLPPDLGYFHNLRWPRVPGEKLATANLFEGLEVLGGYENSPSEITALLRDWFFLLSTDNRITALGNSDTHRADWLRAGYPRSWLRLPTEEPMRVLPSDLRTAIRSMRAIASNGPWVHLKVEGKEIGDTHKVLGGKVRAQVTADAAGWIDLTRLQLYRNGVLFKEIPITKRTHPALQEEIDIPVTEDGWIVAVALGDMPLPIAVIGEVKGGQAKPVALTNPIWLDADGDGVIKQRETAPPKPTPWGVLPEPEESAADLVFAPLHAPLDCEPAEYLTWLRSHRTHP